MKTCCIFYYTEQNENTLALLFVVTMIMMMVISNRIQVSITPQWWKSLNALEHTVQRSPFLTPCCFYPWQLVELFNTDPLVDGGGLRDRKKTNWCVKLTLYVCVHVIPTSKCSIFKWFGDDDECTSWLSLTTTVVIILYILWIIVFVFLSHFIPPHIPLTTWQTTFVMYELLWL